MKFPILLALLLLQRDVRAGYTNVQLKVVGGSLDLERCYLRLAACASIYETEYFFVFTSKGKTISFISSTSSSRRNVKKNIVYFSDRWQQENDLLRTLSFVPPNLFFPQLFFLFHPNTFFSRTGNLYRSI